MPIPHLPIRAGRGALQYLNGKTFKVKDIPFVKKYFPNFKP